MNQIVSQLTIPNRLEYLGPVVAYVREISKIAGFDKKEISQINLAVEEALTNVIQHGLEMNPDESFKITCEQSTTELQIRIQEKGVPFDPESTPKYSPEHVLEDTSGLGTFLMKAAMDEVSFHNLGNKGKEVVLTKHLKGKRIDKCFQPDELAPFQDTPQTEAAPSYEVRKLKPQEAIEISKCAYRAYGYTYMDYIYYPEKIAEYNQNGMMVSLVAVTDQDELMGHAALKFDYPTAPIAEIGVAFVKPQFRKLGLFYALSVRVLETGRKMGLTGMYARAVLRHPISQKMTASMGFADCGIMLGVLPSDLNFKKFAGKTQQRLSEVISFIHFDQMKQATLYPPEEHREMIEWLYGEMNVPYSIGIPDDSDLTRSDRNTNIQSSKIISINIAEIRVSSFSKETMTELKKIWHRYCVDKTDIIYLFLNMEDPLCKTVSKECDELGFVFSGVLPDGVSGRHALVLQYFNNLEMDLDLIVPYSQTAKDVLNYIKAANPFNK